MNTTGHDAFVRHARPDKSRAASLQFFGLAVFTVIVVTTRVPFAQLAIALALLGLIVGTLRLRVPACFWWGMALVAWAFLTSMFALEPTIAREEVLERFKVMLIFLVVLNAIRSERQLQMYILVIVGSFMIYPVRGALLNYYHGETLFGRLIWNNIYANPNDLGALALLALGAALSVATVKSQAPWLRRGLFVAVGLMIAVTLLTQSRGVFLGLLIGFGPLLLVRSMQRAKIAIIALLLIGIGVAFVPDAVWARLSGIAKLTSTSTIAQADPEGSAAMRWEIQKTAWRVFKDHPLMGVGLGSYELANAEYAPELGQRDAHNTYLGLAAELGLPGLVVWVCLVASVFAFVRRHPAQEASAVDRAWIRQGIIAYLIAGLFGSYAGLTMFYLVLGTLWSAAALSSASAKAATVLVQASSRRY